eukprot:TRINITY_DN2754_c0_g1_i1.p1 TRINITY_DN2754_c0_g1~~TRINITY_DN2754_c0_g1_i1.p1  ORF type:complete len:260 (-),score=42.44 TRINITY_DN2754_c0_g1_i1:69-803(-)
MATPSGDLPAQPTTADLQFISTTNLGPESYTTIPLGGGPAPTMKAPPVVTPFAGSYLSDKGFGWLLELEEEDEEEENTSLLEELEINPLDIAYKIRCILFPFKFNRSVLMSSPDFWGPLAVVLFYAFLLIWGQFKVVSWVLTIWLLGSFLIFILARVLGAEVTYSQSIGVIGYSILPLTLAVSTLYVFSPVWYIYTVKVAATAWATLSAESLLASSTEIANKRLLLAYPILLLYIYFISLHNGV